MDLLRDPQSLTDRAKVEKGKGGGRKGRSWWGKGGEVLALTVAAAYLYSYVCFQLSLIFCFYMALFFRGLFYLYS